MKKNKAQKYLHKACPKARHAFFVLDSRMNRSEKILLLILFVFFSLQVSAQKKKDIKKNNIKSVTVTEHAGGKSIKTSKTVFNTANGKIIEETEYDDEGKTDKVIKYKYNTEGKLIEESVFSEKNSLLEKRTYKYNVLKQKSEECLFDEKGKLVKKSIYIYDTKGLKSEKKVFDGNNTLISHKKYTYSFK